MHHKEPKSTTVRINEEATKRLNEIMIKIATETGVIPKRSEIINMMLEAYSEDLIRDFIRANMSQ